MAYSIEFAPSAHQQILALEPRMQRKLLQRLEEEAHEAKQVDDKAKRLRRIRVDDHRLVFLELHPNQRLLVLKIADREDVHRHFHHNDVADDHPAA